MYTVEGSPTTKRRRVKTNRFDFDDVTNEEQRLLQQAIANSKLDMQSVSVEVPPAAVLHPTIEEFKDPLSYINKVQALGEQYGILHIIPPSGWNMPCTIDVNENTKKMVTKLQNVHTLMEGEGFDEGEQYTLKKYRAMADSFREKWINDKHGGDIDVSFEKLELDYWDMVERGKMQATVEYANDLDTTVYGSGFQPKINGVSGKEPEDCPDMFSPAYYHRTGWNLNNLPFIDGSALKYVTAPINGVNVPWLYCGMLFSTFCWHNEDNYLYSINYSHYGSVKQWYGIPPSATKAFETVAKRQLLLSFQDSPDLLHHMTLQIGPSVLAAHGVPVYQIKQTPGTFVITFPKAYHAGFSYGFNVGEAVNFATFAWTPFGPEADERYRLFARPSVLSYVRLFFTLLHNEADIPNDYRRIIGQELLKFINEEKHLRALVLSEGVRDLSSVAKLPRNNFTTMNRGAMDYDDARCCDLCKYVCVFTAVVCECNMKKVACARHYHHMCKCVRQKKYMLSWASNEELNSLIAQVEEKLMAWDTKKPIKALL